jgi:tetratricopeptide (TPR) repeat protein
MSDPLRTDGSRALDAASEADRDAKIEQLLLVGLDHYFAAQYEAAINVWTRALFLDRSHPRARAYIERARSALAERQRESEELLQNGVAAFHRGEGGEARRLLQAAIERGAPSEEALAVLERLDRLDTTIGPRPPARSPRDRRSTIVPDERHAASRPKVALAVSIVLLLGVVVAGVYAAAVWDRFEWRSLVRLQNAPATSAPAPPAREFAPAVPRRDETAMVRARTLAAGGHLRDALSVLDLIRPTDAQKPDADRLRADIQRQLLALTATPISTPEPRENGDGRVP